MNPIYRGWWRLLMDLRPMVRYLAERFPKLAPWGVRLTGRVLHRLVGNPVQVLVVLGRAPGLVGAGPAGPLAAGRRGRRLPVPRGRPPVLLPVRLLAYRLARGLVVSPAVAS